MEKLPESLEIAAWIVGFCWVLAILACLFGASTEWILPIFILGLLTGMAEWILRRNNPTCAKGRRCDG
jgi:hypothetical protein